MSECLNCRSQAASVQCAQCRSAVYCDAECARSHWSDTHQYECRTPIGVPVFFEYGLPLFIASIRNGTINLMDIVAQLQASPKYVKTFLNWINNRKINGGPGIVRALMGWPKDHYVSQRDVSQLIIAMYTLAHIRGFQSVTNQLPVLPGQKVYLDHIQECGNNLDNRLFRFTCAEGSVYLVKYLLTLPGIDVSARDNLAIRWASGYGHLDVVQFLSKLPGVNAGAFDNYAIRAASHDGYLDVVQFLSKLRGVDASARDNEAIRWASRNRHLDVVQFLLTLPQVNITREQAEEMRTEAEDDDMRWFWKSYIDELDIRRDK